MFLLKNLSIEKKIRATRQPRRNVDTKLTSAAISLVLVSELFKHSSGVPNVEEAKEAVEVEKVVVLGVVTVLVVVVVLVVILVLGAFIRALNCC